MSSSCAAIAGGDDVPIPDSRIELSAHIPRYTNLEIVFSTLGFADLSGDKQYINTGNRAEFIHGLEQLVAFLKRKWSRELEYRLIKELWASRKTELPFTLPMNGMTTQVNGIGPTWYRAYGNENWEFDGQGIMHHRYASINDLPIKESERMFHRPQGRRPDDHPGLSDLGL